MLFQNQEVAKSTDALSAQNKENQPREAHCPLLTQPRKFPPGPSSQGLTQPEEGASRSPIYKGQGHKGAEVMADKSWSSGAGNQSRERLVGPGTPYTEIDESKVGLSKKVNVKTCNSNCYTPGIYADGYIVFVFPFVRSYVRSFVSSFLCS